jgi:hypothetical protein
MAATSRGVGGGCRPLLVAAAAGLAISYALSGLARSATELAAAQLPMSLATNVVRTLLQLAPVAHTAAVGGVGVAELMGWLQVRPAGAASAAGTAASAPLQL